MNDIENNMLLVQSQALFQGLSPTDILQSMALLDSCLLPFEKGDCLNRLMDKRSHGSMACMLSGWALLIKYDAWGNQAILDFAMPGYLLGCYKVLTDADFSEICINATSQGAMLCFDAEKLLSTESADEHAAFAQLRKNIMVMLAERSWRLLKKADIVSCHSLREKILSFLDSQREACHNDSFEIPLDRQGLADYLYVNRSALSRELGKLREEGLVDFHRSRFTLLFPRK